MLHFLTDEHISPAVAEQARHKLSGIKITALQHWHEGDFLGTPDTVFITQAIKEGLALVTYDQKTIAPLLKSWAEQGFNHSGIVFVDEKTIAPWDLGGLVKALCLLWQVQRRLDWTNRVIFLCSVV
jgi:hypothetical protein